MFASPVRFWFAVGLLVPAAVLFGWAASTIRGAAGEAWPWTVPGILVVAAVCVPLLALIRWIEGKGRAGGPEPDTAVQTVYFEKWGWRVATSLALLFFLLIFANDTGQAISYTPDHGDRVPLIDFSPYGVALGGGLLVVAFIVLFLSPRALGGPRPRRFVSGGAGLVVSSSVFVVVFVATVVFPVDSTPAVGGADEGAAASVPEQVSEVAWQWRAPEGSGVDQAVRAGAGAVVRYGSGVTALDTVEGEEVWSFRRTGERTRDVIASPDGSLVAVTFLARDRGEGYTLRLVALDAHTGEVRAEHEAPHDQGIVGDLNLPDGFTLTQEGTYVYPIAFDDPADDLVVAYDIDTGDRAWDFAPPEDCYLGHQERRGAHYLLGDEAVVVVQCAPEAAEHIVVGHRYPRGTHDQEVVVLGLDPADGTQNWRHEESVTSEWNRVSAQVGSDALALQWPDGPREEEEEQQVERLFLGPGGEEVSRESTAQHPSILYPTQDGYLELREAGDVWRAFSGKERTASSRYPFTDGIERSILDDAVISVTHWVEEEADSTVTTVTVEPWDDIEGAERHEFEVDLSDGEMSGGEGVATLLPAPGSVVLAAGTPLVVGLE